MITDHRLAYLRSAEIQRTFHLSVSLRLRVIVACASTHAAAAADAAVEEL